MSRPLGPAQWEMLQRVCRSNGAGLNGYSENRRIYRSLEARGLVQGKQGQPYLIVHTRDGLDLFRAKIAESEAAK